MQGAFNFIPTWSYHGLKPEFYESSDSLFICCWGGGARMGNNGQADLVMDIGCFLSCRVNWNLALFDIDCWFCYYFFSGGGAGASMRAGVDAMETNVLAFGQFLLVNWNMPCGAYNIQTNWFSSGSLLVDSVSGPLLRWTDRNWLTNDYSSI